MTQRIVIVSSRVMKFLGEGSPKSSILASAILPILCLFYIYAVGTYLQIQTNPLIGRITYYAQFNYYIVNEYVDHIAIGCLLILWLLFSLSFSVKYPAIGGFAVIFVAIAVINYRPMLEGITLSALPLVIILFLIRNRYCLLNRSTPNNNNVPPLELTINYSVVIGIIVGFISFVFAIAPIMFPNFKNNDNVIASFRSYAYDLFLLFSNLSPFLLVSLLACVPIKLSVDFVKTRIRHRSSLQNDFLSKGNKTTTIMMMASTTRVIALSLSVVLSMIFVIVPHLPALNVDNHQAGVDTLKYSAWIKEMSTSPNALDFLHQVFVKHSGGDRPITLILIFAFYQLILQTGSADPGHQIEYFPLILGPLLVLAIYFLVKDLVSNHIAPLFAAFLTAVSFQTLIGIYAGFYANWTALIFAYLSSLFLFRFLRDAKATNLVLYGIFLTLTLLSHVYTWSIIAMVSGIFLIVCFVKAKYFSSHRKKNNNNDNYVREKMSMINMPRRKKTIVLLFLVLICTVVIDVARSSLTGSSAGIERDIQIGQKGSALDQFLLCWQNLTYTMTAYEGGLFANFIVFGLGLYWLVTSGVATEQNVFMLVFLSIGILPFLFGNSVIQTRVFYDIPFQIPAALGLSSIVHRQTNNNLWQLRVTPICIWLIAISLVYVSNFPLKMP